MVNNALVPQAEAILRVEHFDKQAHRAIYAAAVELSASGRPVDTLSLRDELGKALEPSGGVSYIASLLDGLPNITNLEHWAKIVKDKARRRTALKLGQRLTEQAEFGAQDTDELLDEHQTSLARLIEADDRKLRRMGDYLPEALENLESFTHSKNGITGIETGIYSFDRLTGGLGNGWLVILGARSGRGKSAFCAQAAINAANQGKRVLVFCMEMPGPEITERTLLSEAGVNKWDLKSPAKFDNAWSKVMKAYGRLNELPVWLDCSEMPTLAHVRAVAQQQKSRAGIDLLIVDHLHRMHCDPRQERWIAVGEIARGLKSLALRLNVPVLAACQLNAEAQEKRPTMAMLQQAQSVISAEADLVALLHPENPAAWGQDQNPLVHLLVDKFRHGQEMDIPLIFLKEQVRFGETVQEEWRSS